MKFVSHSKIIGGLVWPALLYVKKKAQNPCVEDVETALHAWMNGHHSDINHQCLEKPVAENFNLTSLSLEDLSVFNSADT